ncbi:MAG: hypothetical protein ACJAVI_003467 [Candidatus Azotimanducaceae bacterium]|jgi:hypothetical protein
MERSKIVVQAIESCTCLPFIQGKTSPCMKKVKHDPAKYENGFLRHWLVSDCHCALVVLVAD